MAKEKHVAPPAAKPPTEKGLAAAVKKATDTAAGIAKKRHKIRDTTPRGKVVAALEPTDADYAAALDGLAAAEKAYGRFTRGGGPGQTVKVGSATESEGP